MANPVSVNYMLLAQQEESVIRLKDAANTCANVSELRSFVCKSDDVKAENIQVVAGSLNVHTTTSLTDFKKCWDAKKVLDRESITRDVLATEKLDATKFYILEGPSTPIAAPVAPVISSSGNVQSTDAPHSPVTPPRDHVRQVGEGLVVETDAAVTYRAEAVKFITEKVDNERAVLVRSPPMSGKTSMCSLISRRLRELGRPVIHVSMLRLSLTKMSEDPAAAWNEFWLLCTKQLLTYWTERRYVIIVDEAQFLYGSELPPPVADFWKTVKSVRDNDNSAPAKFILFSSYSESSTPGAGTPVWFDNPLGVDFLLLNPIEADELSTSYTERLAGRCVPIDKEVFGLIVQRCGHHIGFIRATLSHIFNHFERVTHSEAPSRKSLVEFLHSRDLITALAQVRAVASTKVTSLPAVRDLLMRVLNSVDYAIPYVDDDDVMLNLIRNGMLVHLHGGKVGFASPVVKDVLIWRYLRSREIARAPGQPSFYEFLKCTISLMNPDALRNSYSVAADGTLLERQWQNEFYRAASLCLGADRFISPDVGRALGVNRAYVDYFVNSTLKWGIEITKGSSLAEHLARFETGPYGQMIKNLTIDHWKLVDFQPDSPSFQSAGKEFWHVLYDPANFSQMSILYYPEKATVPVRESIRLLQSERVSSQARTNASSLSVPMVD